MIAMRAERLAKPMPASSRETALDAENIALKEQIKALASKNAALEAEISRLKGTGTMIPLEAYATLQSIIKAAAAVGGTTVEELRGKRKAMRLSLIRHAAIYVAYRNIGRLSYPQIARHFGHRDHTSAMHAVRRIQIDVDAGNSVVLELLRDIRTAAGVVARQP